MTDPRVQAAFAAAPRRDFLPERQRGLAGQDRPIAIGFGMTNSQPRTVADMLELLEVQAGHRVLDVGAGSGWTTALLAHLVGPAGRVLGVERVPELAEWGGANVARHGVPWAEVRAAAPGVLGLPDEGPFDRILVSAEADELPGDLVDQLAPGGRLVIPVRGRMLLVQGAAGGDDDDEPVVTAHGYYAFVPLVRDAP